MPELDPLQAAAVPFAPLIGVAALMRRAFRNEDLGPLGAALLARATAHPGDAHAFLDCSTILQLVGSPEVALAMQARAIEMQQLYALPPRRPGPGVRLLVVMGPGALMWNTPVELLVEEADIALELLYLAPEADWPDAVPDHDVLLVAVAESATNQPLLQRLAVFLADWPRPVLNRPERIATLARDAVCALLGDVPGLAMPVTLRADRAHLQALGDGVAAASAGGIAMPFIVRPVDSHAGKNLERMQSGADVAAYLARLDGDQFFVSPFVDYRSADGLYRKYRIALVDGQPYVCHFAVSAHWMVHYLNAGMHESADKRAEEAACMANFAAGFGLRHAAALQAIYRRTGLPYLQVDCAETPAGELLVFEIGNAMVVHALDDAQLYPYKEAAMDKVFAAFRHMLERARHVAPSV